jgi:hypothetical protein
VVFTLATARPLLRDCERRKTQAMSSGGFRDVYGGFRIKPMVGRGERQTFLSALHNSPTKLITEDADPKADAVVSQAETVDARWPI